MKTKRIRGGGHYNIGIGNRCAFCYRELAGEKDENNHYDPEPLNTIPRLGFQDNSFGFRVVFPHSIKERLKNETNSQQRLERH